MRLSRSDETRRALALQEAVMVDAQEADDAWAMTVAEATAALLARRLDEREATRQLLAAASLRAAGIGPQAAGYVLGMRAQAYLEDGEPEAAAALLREGIALARDGVPVQLLAWAHVLLAQALVLCDRPREATRELTAALATPHASTELDLLATWLDVHAALAWKRGSREDAVVALASSDAVRSSIGKVRRRHEDDIVAPVRDAPTGGLALPAAEAAARGRAVLLSLAG